MPPPEQETHEEAARLDQEAEARYHETRSLPVRQLTKADKELRDKLRELFE